MAKTRQYIDKCVEMKIQAVKTYVPPTSMSSRHVVKSGPPKNLGPGPVAYNSKSPSNRSGAHHVVAGPPVYATLQPPTSFQPPAYAVKTGYQPMPQNQAYYPSTSQSAAKMGVPPYGKTGMSPSNKVARAPMSAGGSRSGGYAQNTRISGGYKPAY